MNVKIQNVRFTADSKLNDYVNRKLEKLSTFHDRITRVDVYLKLDNVVHAIKDKINRLLGKTEIDISDADFKPLPKSLVPITLEHKDDDNG